ncbi:ROK family protein [Novosphingobium sp. NDB2Meth1]|uniref:ROK family protein n=1 Tax=Novosphingobium sp. NDB2Meth1 TaxID=1892847 RepID=UPI000930C7FA|nr:ROK family protein [Novosphingobium sp. NDB2Meth1]
MIAGLELGGTKCVATLAEGREVIDQRRVPTRDAPATVSDLTAILDIWCAAYPIEAIGVAAFGPIQTDRSAADFGTFLATPKPGWQGFGLAAHLQERYDLPVGLDSDVNGAALAEGRWGGAQGMANHAYITVGTGVGVGLVVGGRTMAGRAHSEMGHIFVDRAPGDDAPGICPFHGGCVEGLIAGPALAARTGRSGEALDEMHPVWNPFVHVLARLVHTIVLTGASERVALGGGVLANRPGLVARVEAAARESLGGYAQASFTVGAPVLGDQAGPMGALAIALDVLEGAEA